MNSDIIIKEYTTSYKDLWNDFVLSRSDSCLYQLIEWKEIIEKTYNHKTFYAMAVDKNSCIKGVLPLVQIKSLVFGHKLISLPYFDMGGILADNKDAFQKLIEYGFEKLESLNAQSLELRDIRSSDYKEKEPYKSLKNGFYTSDLAEDKAVMRLDLPENSEELFNSYKSKFRNDIRKPFRNGLEFKIGGRELLNDFYHIFSVNMRDLGSPVHSFRLFENIFSSFQEKAQIGAVYKDNKPVAAIFTIGFRDILANPWASALREYRRLNVNIFQYWKMLEYGCDNKYKIFDFGRSAPEDSTFKFKKKWGAVPYPLVWENFSIKYKEKISEKSKFGKFIKYWQKTPVFITKAVGPPIRKNIGL